MKEANVTEQDIESSHFKKKNLKVPEKPIPQEKSKISSSNVDENYVSTDF